MERLLKLTILLLFAPSALSAATGSWNGVAITGLNGVAQTSWNGTSISCAAYQTYATDLDGSAAYFSATTLTGISDSKLVTAAGWFRIDGGDGTTRRMMVVTDSGFNPKFATYLDTANKFNFFGRRAADTTVILWFVSTAAYTAGASWHHYFCYANMADSGARGVYIDGSSAAGTWSTYTDDTLDLAGAHIYIGSSNGGGLWNGCVAEMWIAGGTALTDVTAFRSASTGKPISLGATGSAPGVTPAGYWHNIYSNFQTDTSGNGNTLSVSGSPTAGSTSPTD